MKLLIQKIDPNTPDPHYALAKDAGLDIYSSEQYLLKPHERHLFSTGIKVALPKNHVGLIWDKSGLAVKYGLKTMAGVIDEGYRGEIMILILNTSNKKYLVEKYSKIAQLIIQKRSDIKISIVNKLDKTERNKKGFGSTGLK